MKTWNNMTWEEKVNEVVVINDTYKFSTDYEDAATAAWNVRNAYENVPESFDFEVEDLDKFENELKDIIESNYFTLQCDIDMESFYRETENTAWDGWFCPVWAKVEGDEITLSLGGAVSQGTTFRNDEGKTPKSWVGNIPCWKRTYGENDAEQWAEDNGCDPEDFDSDEVMDEEIENWDLSYAEDIIKEGVREFAKSKGFKVVF